LATSELSLTTDSDGIVFWIHVTPRAKKPGVGGQHGDALRVQVSAPPLVGMANAACTRAIALALGCSRNAVEIAPGSKSRRKRVRVSGSPVALREAIASLARSAQLG
jgi:uncharacterized protein (TIGR00251 family)